MNFQERIRGHATENGEWEFDLAEELNGGFGGTNGGTLAAVCVYVARAATPGRIPAGVDAKFIRGFRPGKARVVPTVLNEGRTLSTISIDILTEEGKLSTRGTVTMVMPEALADVDRDGTRAQLEKLKTYEEGKVWKEPENQPIPLINTFSPRFMGAGEAGIATGTQVIWQDENATAEAACIAADISVGPPVAGALKGMPLAMPNPDISLRFTGADAASDHLVSTCRLESVTGGLATTSLDVRSGDTLIAVGISTTTCLKGK